MFTKLKTGLAATLFLASTAQAAVVVDLVGDVDGLGGNVAGNAFLGPFDNRSAAELAATDGAQQTDNATQSFGTNYVHGIFTHNFGAFSSITSATWELGVGGLQSFNDTLSMDGTVVASGADLPDQGPQGFGIYSLTITDFTDLLDGMVIFDLHLNTNSTGEPVVFDFARLTIEGTQIGTPPNAVPVPAAAILFAPALLGFLGLRRKAKNAV